MSRWGLLAVWVVLMSMLGAGAIVPHTEDAGLFLIGMSISGACALYLAFGVARV